MHHGPVQEREGERERVIVQGIRDHIATFTVKRSPELFEDLSARAGAHIVASANFAASNYRLNERSFERDARAKPMPTSNPMRHASTNPDGAFPQSIRRSSGEAGPPTTRSWSGMARHDSISRCGTNTSPDAANAYSTVLGFPVSALIE